MLTVPKVLRNAPKVWSKDGISWTGTFGAVGLRDVLAGDHAISR